MKYANKKVISLRKAFSLVELSVVIIIIGILIAGVTQGTRLIDETRLKTARSLTANSIVNSMEGLILWYETTMVTSFSKTDAVDGKVISQWNDINPQGSRLHAKAGQKTDSAQNTYNSSVGGTIANTRGPTYFEDGVNHIPTLNFVQSAAPSFQYLVTDRQLNNNPRDSMTLFYVMRYNGGTGYFIDRACYSDAVGSSRCSDFYRYGVFANHVGAEAALYVTLRDDNFVDFSGCSGTFCLTGYTLIPGKSYIITLQRDYGVSFVTYINGSSSYSSNSTKADNGEPLSVDPFKIGAHDYLNINTLNMDMSEVIFFSGAITKRNRQAVEDYLGKKYNIAVSH